MTDYNTSLDLVAKLVKQFHTNRAAYHAPNYKEAHARQDLIDPLFIALGWDVHNEERAAPKYRQVILEDSVEIEGEDARKAPDYAFRIGETRKFFAEAKKPGVALKTAAAPAYQLRRYAWSAKLPFSLLTDFEELAVYDCRSRPSEKHKANVGRHNFYTFEEYPDRWREIWDVFSREAVRGGSFDQFAQAGKGRGTSEVDAEFLREIEGWRDVLARNMALRNPHLGIDDLNDAVQRTIDRVIFLRMAEDRGIEPYEQLCRLAEKDGVYGELIDLCGKADAKYNAGLFDLSPKGDPITTKLSVDDKVLKPIIIGLYFPQSPYEFSVLPIQVLGNIYEQFLGKVIRLTAAHQAKVEPKPEVRKAGGVFYTPTYIVDYIVKNTVGKLVEGKSPKQLAGDSKGSPFRALDMACGSGSFLLGVYQLLLDYYLHWYVEHDPNKHPNAVWQRGEEWRLTIAAKKRILTTHIFGVDIDRQAVEVTKLSLLLKVLEGESTETLQMALPGFQERALPNLDNNIKCGNSLIGPDYFTGQLLPNPDELRRVNPFDWEREFPDAMRAGGFDCIVGNPPYIRIQTMKEWAPLEVEIYKELYESASAGNYDIYVVFVEKALSLLNERGRMGFILPHKFFNAQYGEPLRALLAKGKHLSHVVHFGDQQVFAGATTYTCLMFLDKAGRDECQFIKVDDLTVWRATGKATEGKIPAANVTATEWNFTIGKGAALFEQLSRTSVKLGNIASIFVGLQTSADKIYILEEAALLKGRRVRIKDQNGAEWTMERDVLRPFLNDVTVATFEQPISRHWLIFPYRLESGKATLIPASEMASSYPQVWEYLKENSKVLRGRESGKADTNQWYGYIYRKNLTLFDTPKLIVQVISLFGRYAHDESGLYFTGGGNGPYYGVRWSEPDNLHSLHYLQALLGSRLLDFYLHKISSPFRGGYWSYGKRFIEQLPIRLIDFSNPTDVARHERMVTLVEQMLELHKRLAAARSQSDQELYQRQIDARDKEIDKLVYDLYGLTEEEIRIVEEEVR